MLTTVLAHAAARRVYASLVSICYLAYNKRKVVILTWPEDGQTKQKTTVSAFTMMLNKINTLLEII